MDKAQEQASTQETQMVCKNLKICSTSLRANKCRQNILTFQWAKIKKLYVIGCWLQCVDMFLKFSLKY